MTTSEQWQPGMPPDAQAQADPEVQAGAGQVEDLGVPADLQEEVAGAALWIQSQPGE